VEVQFVVDEQRRTRDVEAVRISYPEFDAAAKHVVLVMPWWTPGVDKGQPLRGRGTLATIFVPAKPVSIWIGPHASCD